MLLVSSSQRELSALVARIRWSGAAFGALGIVFGFALSYVLASRVTRPVEQLADAARAVAGGDWNVQVDSPHASAEIADLARAFDTMTRQLVDQRDRLVQVERVAAWRELARRLAHELKNPLFPLRITLDNLRRARSLPPGEFDEVFEESMGTLTTGLGNLNTVIGRFSDFARMPAPEMSDVSPNAIVRQTVTLFQAQLASPGSAGDCRDARPRSRGRFHPRRRRTARSRAAEPAAECDRRDAGRAARSPSGRGVPAAVCSWMSPTPERASRTRSASACSRRTTRPSSTAPGSAWRSCSPSSPIMAAGSGWRANPGAATTFHIELPGAVDELQ